MVRRHARKLLHPSPKNHWTEEMEAWKAQALGEVLRELEHICAGPRALPKSFCLSEAVHNVVAREYDPESEPGVHLLHILSGAIAQQIMRRTKLPADLPDGRAVPHDFASRYLNSRWWLDAFLQAEGACCCDVQDAVRAAMEAAEKEVAEMVTM